MQMHNTASVVAEAAPVVPDPVIKTKHKKSWRSKFANWLLDGPPEPTIWEKIQYPLKWCIVVLGFLTVGAVVAVAGVIILPFAMLKIGLMLPD